VAQTGIGAPVTRGVEYYEHHSGVFGMYDCVGFETGQSGDEILASFRATVDHCREFSIDKHIHVAWHVLRWSDRRFEHSQVNFIKELSETGLPVVLVLSQVPKSLDGIHPDAIELGDYMVSEVGDVIAGGRPIFTNSMEDLHQGNPSHGLLELLEITVESAPEGVKAAVVAAQRIDRDRKEQLCRVIVTAAALAAAGIGATPIPFSDAAFLIPAQIVMMSKISANYNLTIDAAVLAKVAVAATLTTGVATVLGRSLGNLIKLIPGVSSAAGGLINGSIATSLTLGIGIAWIKVCDYLADLDADQIDVILNNISEINSIFLFAFRDQVSMKRMSVRNVVPQVKLAARVFRCLN
jgi:uncharacterized protein (DUF697 family)